MLRFTKGWKTVTFNILATAVPLLELTELQGIVPEDYLPHYVLGVALANMVLRALTTTPMGIKG
jgi:hypothetical protein